MSTAFTWIEGEIPEQHRIFDSTRLPFIPLTTLDRAGPPWSSILAGSSGESGFVTSPRWDQLELEVHIWDGDPFSTELTTRRRNQFAGSIVDIRRGCIPLAHRNKLQAIGNCPTYINIRELHPHPETTPVVVYRRLAVDKNATS
ncbi:hypothetical protein BC835DRAFT_1414382 [Cytidiella melzeri]|nr:hypothetical protein BC835DRAFT_1414382 [Cytidiella melzeri]